MRFLAISAVSAISIAGSATTLALVIGSAGASRANTAERPPAISVTFHAPTPQANADIGPVRATVTDAAAAAPAQPIAEALAPAAPAPADPVDTVPVTPAGAPEPARAGGAIEDISIDAMRARIVALHNQARAAHGLMPFTLSPELQIAAQRHAEWLTHYTTGELWNLRDRAHAGEGGSTYRERIVAAGYPGQATNESFGAFATPDAAFEWWLGDPWHRPQIVSDSFHSIGIGIAPHSSGQTTVFIITYGGP